jgi:hypothetical protein
MVTSRMTTAEKLFHSLFSPPRPIQESKDPNSQDEDHNKNSADTGISPRCAFRSSDGRQCRNQPSRLCVHHSSRKEREGRVNGFPDFPQRRNVYPQDELSPLKDVGPALVALCGDLTTATNINRALSQVFLLMAQGRIPQKQAVAFGYISQLLLQTVPGIRSEYVSVHGYRDWENRLKTSLTQNTNEAPDPSPEGENKRPTTAAADHPARMVVPSEQRERGAASPDYANIFRRSRDMIAGKYDTTPEGRREANALALELELMNPAPAKARKDFFSRTVALVRSLREHQTKKFGAASQPPSAPAPFPTAPVPSSVVSAPSKTEAAQSVASPPATHEVELCSSGRGVAQPALRSLSLAAQPAASADVPSHDKNHDTPSPSDSNARDHSSVALRSRRPPEKVYEQPSDQSPKDRPKQEMPVPGITLARTGHTTAWYAPASWSGRQPDPYRSRKEKLRCSLRVASDRRRQHQMQNRAFWR